MTGPARPSRCPAPAPLAEYVESLECTVADSRRRLGQLKEEKRKTEELLWKQQHALERSGGGCALQDFEAGAAGELPPRIRAIFEDNKVRPCAALIASYIQVGVRTLQHCQLLCPVPIHVVGFTHS